MIRFCIDIFEGFLKDESFNIVAVINPILRGLFRPRKRGGGGKIATPYTTLMELNFAGTKFCGN